MCPNSDQNAFSESTTTDKRINKYLDTNQLVLLMLSFNELMISRNIHKVSLFIHTWQRQRIV